MPGPTRPMSDNAAIVAGLAELLARAEPLMSHNYVLVEALALVQHRLGAVAALDADFRALRVEWVEGLIWQCLEWPSRSATLS